MNINCLEGSRIGCTNWEHITEQDAILDWKLLLATEGIMEIYDALFKLQIWAVFFKNVKIYLNIYMFNSFIEVWKP